MSLAVNLQTLATRIATEVKVLRTLINGNALDNSALTTVAKSNLVAAINELDAAIDTIVGGGVATDLDSLTDVVLSGPTTGHLLRHNGTSFVNVLGTTHFQAADPDLTSIAALTTTAYGRDFLALANQAALMVLVAAASETVAGKVELSTQAEVTTGTDDVTAVTPLKLQTRLAAYAQPLDGDLTSIAALVTTAYGRGFLTLADQTALMALVQAASATVQGKVELAIDAEAITGTDTVRAVTPANLAAVFTDRIDTSTALGSSNTKVASQAAVKAYADALIGANDAMVFKGVLDCSASPNYPAANRGDTYRVSVAGKVGSVSGPVVEVGDLLLCLTDGTASGVHATVGANWTIVQSNLDGAVIGPASAVSGNIPTFSGTTGKVIADTGVVITAFGKTLIDDADAAAGRTTLDVYSKTEIGNPETDFVATFNAGLV